MIPAPRALKEFLAAYDRQQDASFVEAAERERSAFIERFPMDKWPTMQL